MLSIRFTLWRIEMTGDKWTEEEIQYVKDNHGIITQREMAEKLQRKPRSIHNLVKKLNLPNLGEARWDKIITKEFLELEHISKGRTLLGIAKDLGCAESTLIKYKKIHKIETQNNYKHKNHVDDRHDEYIMQNRHLHYDELRERLGISIWFLRKRLDVLGIRKIESYTERARQPFEPWEDAFLLLTLDFSLDRVGDYLKRGRAVVNARLGTLGIKKNKVHPRIKPGDKFGKLTALYVCGKENNNRGNVWMCSCECFPDKQLPVKARSLVHGLSQSCGCRTGHGYIKGSKWKSIQAGAKARNHDCLVTIEHINDLLIKQNFRCAISGLEIGFAATSEETKHGGDTASLDRIDSDKGYIEGNVQWLHKDINMMKQSFPQEYFLELIRTIYKYQENHNV